MDFYLASSEAVSDAVLTLRVAAEMDNISLSPDNYTIEVNGQPVMFDAIALEKEQNLQTALLFRTSLCRSAQTRFAL